MPNRNKQRGVRFEKRIMHWLADQGFPVYHVGGEWSTHPGDIIVFGPRHGAAVIECKHGPRAVITTADRKRFVDLENFKVRPLLVRSRRGGRIIKHIRDCPESKWSQAVIL